MWQRTCPWCKSQGANVTLRKRWLWQVVQCICGWTWGGDDEQSKLLSEDLTGGPQPTT